MSNSPPGTPSWRPGVGQIPPRWPGWQLERKIGAGSVGQVWIARHQQSEATRIFKFCCESDRQRAFERELPRLQLIHERLADRDDCVRLREVCADERPYCLEMDHVEAPDLAVWSRRQRGLSQVPLETRLALLVAAAKTIGAAHAAGILHQGLKPANIFIIEHEGRPRPLLADFGLAAIAARCAAEPASGAVASAATGDPARLYEAPETLAGSPGTTAVDLYALGVLLYQFVLGDLSRPLRAGWDADVADELLREDIAACTHHNPARRLASAAELAERLATLETRREARESQIRGEQAAKRMKRAKAALSAVAALALALAGWAALATYGWRTAEDEAREMLVLKQNADVTATEAREAETAALDAARESGELAAAQNQLALDTLKAVIFDVQSAAKNLPEAGEARRRMLESVLSRLDEVSDEFVAHSEIDRNKLHALIELGDVFSELDPAPQDTEPVAGDAADLVRPAATLQRAGKSAGLETASRFYEQAAGIAKKVAEESPGDEQAQRDLQLAYSRLGDALQRLGRAADALKYRQESLQITRRLADARPADAKSELEVAESNCKLGIAKQQAGQNAAAIEYY
ncbi:MAG TPA: protein kinase, partial [Pirellulales bacterium]|nr:protein kinase [Pirellulales bacterium]